GYSGFNYDAFDRAEAQLVALGDEPVSPADPAQRHPDEPDRLAPGVSYEDCLAQTVERLLSADAVALLPGWVQSRGARLGVALARRRGMEIRPLASWLRRAEHPGAPQRWSSSTQVRPRPASARPATAEACVRYKRSGPFCAVRICIPR